MSGLHDVGRDISLAIDVDVSLRLDILYANPLAAALYSDGLSLGDGAPRLESMERRAMLTPVEAETQA